MCFPFIQSGKKSVNIDTLYNYAKAGNVTLFPTENYDFWLPYEANYAKFDRYFYQKFRAFKVCQDYEANTSNEAMLADFKQIIDAHLFINNKRYSELYRVQVLASDAYDVVNNYDLNETISRTNTGTVKDNIGTRADQDVIGGQTHEEARGARSGQTQYGATENTSVFGAKTDTNQTTLGAQTSSSTSTRSAFNSGTLQNVSGGSINNGNRQDSATLIEGSHTDTASSIAHTDSNSSAAYTDTMTDSQRTDTHTTGAQENVRTDDLNETTTIRRYGNIGVQTPADVIGGHIDLWEAFRFYQMIFDEIAAEYLVIDVEFDFYNAGSAASSSNPSNAMLLAAIRELAANMANDSDVGVVREDIADTHAAVSATNAR